MIIRPSRAYWPEATILAEPEKHPKEPTVLVRRNAPMLSGADGNTDIALLPGLPVISLFTGAGGMDIGVEGSGFCTLVQHEYDKDACGTLLHNRPDYFRHAALIQGDIRETPTSMLLREAGLRVGEPALVCGGPPCQGFSTSNSKSHTGTYDERNDLVMQFLRVIRESQPRFFMMENVPGFLTFPGKVGGVTYPEMFCRAAYDSYYEMVYGLLNACDYGVPQNRTRFICIGTRRDYAEIDDTIAGLPAPAFFSRRDLSIIDTPRITLFGSEETEETRLIKMAPGVRYFPDRPFLKPPRPNNGSGMDTDGRSSTYLEFYRRLAEEEPDRLIQPARAA